MRGIILAIFFSTLLFAEIKDNRKEFLTPYEYGRALYSNPRGIGCNECHGSSGEGAVISYVRVNNKTKPITAPRITNIDFKTFDNALRSGKGIMPKYNLTAREKVSLYIFLNPNVKIPNALSDNN